MNPRPATLTSVHLDLIRGVSAAAVMLYHLRWLVCSWIIRISANKSLLSTALYSGTYWDSGYQVVKGFSLFSAGYFIGNKPLWNRWGSGSGQGEPIP